MDIRQREEHALTLFDQGFNCAESALTALGQDGEAMPAGLSSFATAFGAGVARQGHLCGCLTGAAIALSCARGRTDPHDSSAKDSVYAAVKRLLDKFTERFGAVDCRTLTGLDFDVPLDRKAYLDHQHAVCKDYLQSVVRWAAEEQDRLREEKERLSRP